MLVYILFKLCIMPYASPFYTHDSEVKCTNRGGGGGGVAGRTVKSNEQTWWGRTTSSNEQTGWGRTMSSNEQTGWGRTM